MKVTRLASDRQPKMVANGGLVWLMLVTTAVVLIAGPLSSVTANFYGKRGQTRKQPAPRTQVHP